MDSAGRSGRQLHVPNQPGQQFQSCGGKFKHHSFVRDGGHVDGEHHLLRPGELDLERQFQFMVLFHHDSDVGGRAGIRWESVDGVCHLSHGQLGQRHQPRECDALRCGSFDRERFHGNGSQFNDGSFIELVYQSVSGHDLLRPRESREPQRH